MRILIVEDNRRLAQAIQRGLQQHGFSVDVANLGRQGEEMAASEVYDLVILDVMLPDCDGLAVCRALRRRGVASYILILTGLSAVSQKVTGLESGADDYLTKPFEFPELLARIRALLRRGTATEAIQYRYGDLVVDLLRREVRRGDRNLHLRPKELSVLELLMRNADRVVDRMTIANKVWGAYPEPSDNAIDKCLSSLRQKVDQGSESPLIHTVVGSGYRFGSDPGGE